MKPTVIHHPLRTISLAYNSDAALSDLECAALTQYQVLHNEAMAIKNYFLALHPEITRMMRQLNRLSTVLSTLEGSTKRYRDLAGYTPAELADLKPESYTLKPKDLKMESQHFQLLINQYWLQKEQLAEQLPIMLKKHKSSTADLSSFRKTYFSPIIQGWAQMVINTTSLDADVHAFCRELDLIDKLLRRVVTDWNAWMRELDQFTITATELAKHIATVFIRTNTLAILQFNKDGELKDSSLHERLWLVQPGTGLVEEYKQIFEKIAAKPENNLVLTVEPHIVKEGQVTMFHELIIALQHYPGIIEQLVFGIEFHFMLVEGLDIRMGEQEWKTQADYHRWFYKMGESPLAIFFIKDSEGRFYSLAGDMTAEGEIKYSTSMLPDARQMQIITDRFFHSCWFFLMYCRGSGFNPKIYIEALIAEYDMPFVFEDVERQYQADVDKGIEFRVGMKG